MSGGGKRKQAWEGSGSTALDNDKRRRVASSTSAMPKATHKPEYNEQLQEEASTHRDYTYCNGLIQTYNVRVQGIPWGFHSF